MASIFSRLFGRQEPEQTDSAKVSDRKSDAASSHGNAAQFRENAAQSRGNAAQFHGDAASTNENAAPRSADSNFVRLARETIHNEDTVSAAIRAFAEVCRVPVTAHTEQLSFDTGTYALTGRPMFYISLVRSYAKRINDDEYTRLHIDLLYPPEEATAAFTDALWSDSFASTEEFLDAVRADPACVMFADRKADAVEIYTDLN